MVWLLVHSVWLLLLVDFCFSGDKLLSILLVWLLLPCTALHVLFMVWLLVHSVWLLLLVDYCFQIAFYFWVWLLLPIFCQIWNSSQLSLTIKGMSLLPPNKNIGVIAISPSIYCCNGLTKEMATVLSFLP